MIWIENKKIATVPTLHVIQKELVTKRVPTVFFLHGYGSAKEHNLHVAYLLAEKGFRVILPDALHHGEREQSLKGSERDTSFWEIVLTSISEFEHMVSELQEKGLVTKSQIGMSGTSMGAITMYGALAKYDWLKVAASFMGTAYYESFANDQLHMLHNRGGVISKEEVEEILHHIRPFDLSTQLHMLSDRHLFIWHGEEDDIVPYHYSKQLYDTIQNNVKSMTFINEKKFGHRVSRYAILQAVHWFTKMFHQ